MDTVINILISVLPACITGAATFLVTKYNYHRNIPLDKLEITYNRLYYPIYRLLRDNKETMDVIEQSDKYIKKYGKSLRGRTQSL